MFYLIFVDVQSHLKWYMPTLSVSTAPVDGLPPEGTMSINVGTVNIVEKNDFVITLLHTEEGVQLVQFGVLK